MNIGIPIKLTDPTLRRLRAAQLRRVRRFNRWSRETDIKFQKMRESINRWGTA